jgi:hypothetical protein
MAMKWQNPVPLWPKLKDPFKNFQQKVWWFLTKQPKEEEENESK